MKKIFACALCVVMTVSLCSCAGCRKKEETKAKEKETIELWYYWDIPDNQRHLEELVEQFRNISSVIDTNIFNSIHNINLNTVIGYHKDDMKYNFLDDYDTKGKKTETEG